MQNNYSHCIGDFLCKMKTWSVALVLCLNIGVDPPDVVKTSPCARKECWIGNIITAHCLVLMSIIFLIRPSVYESPERLRTCGK